MTLTAGSPVYLTLLDSLRQPSNQFHAGADLWDMLESRWDWFEIGKNEHTLLRLAETAYDILALEQDTTRQDIISAAADLHLRKNAGYAGLGNPDPWANFRLCERFGIPAHVGVYVRMTDKWIRIRNLRANPNNDQVNESLHDTLADLAAYALIAICLLQERTA